MRMNNRKRHSRKGHKGVSGSVLQIVSQKTGYTCKVDKCHTHCLGLVGLPGVGGIELPPYRYQCRIVLLEVHFLLPYKLMMITLFWLSLRVFLEKLLGKKETHNFKAFTRG